MKGKKKGKRHNFKHVSKKEKHNTPGVTGYISRTQAMRKLQLGMKQFRQLCIYKGIHPVEPGLKRIRKISSKTWYYLKDINFMRRDELVNYFAEMKIYKKKVAHLKGVNKPVELAALKQRKPKLNMDHFVRERYSTYQDAVSDLDDAVSLICLFVEMQYGVTAKIMKKKQFAECIRLKSEWMAYIAETHSLRKVFCSIKGIYYQADVLGSAITWLVPHSQRVKVPVSVDVSTMSFFVDFYITMLNFVLYRLFTDIGLKYPPAIDSELLGLGKVVKAVHVEKELPKTPVLKNETPAAPSAAPPALTQAERERIAIVNSKLAHIISVDQQEGSKEAEMVEVKAEPKEEGQEIPEEFKKVDEKEGENTEQYVQKSMLFARCKFFINREIPKSELRFMIRAFGGEDFDEYDCKENDKKITHQIVDRALNPKSMLKNREYIQPQWIFDSINSGILLPYHEYAHDAKLPAHISPFINNEGYVPEQREHLNELIKQQNGDVEKQEKDEEEGEAEYQGADVEEDQSTIEAQYARELAAEQQGKSYAGYVQDEMGETEMYSDSDLEKEKDSEDEELEAALKKKPKTRKEKAAEKAKKDEEEREGMAIDLLTRKVRRKVVAIKSRLERGKVANDVLMEKRKDIAKKKKKEERAARKALPPTASPTPIEVSNAGGKRKGADASSNPTKSAKKAKKSNK